MVRRGDEGDDEDFQYARRPPPPAPPQQMVVTPSGFSSWMQFALGGLIAGLVAWGGMSSKLENLKEGLTNTETRAERSREELIRTIDAIRSEVNGLRSEISTERKERLEERLLDREDRASLRRGPTFPHGKTLD